MEVRRRLFLLRLSARSVSLDRNTPRLPSCQVNSGDELVAAEIIFGGTLAELEPEEAVALLSALVFQASFVD